MKIQTYYDMKIITLRSTNNPQALIQLAADTTQKRVTPTNTKEIKLSNTLIETLLKANHTSLFEHASISFGIEGISRSLLLQLTRHRMCSYTVSSQHYQDCSDYPMSVSPENHGSFKHLYSNAFRIAIHEYKRLLRYGLPKEEARQVLPGAMTCNLIWTINARSLFHFLNIRTCKRNIEEMQIFSNYVLALAVKWWPELFGLCGPDCELIGECTQGVMSCKKKKKKKKK